MLQSRAGDADQLNVYSIPTFMYTTFWHTHASFTMATAKYSEQRWQYVKIENTLHVWTRPVPYRFLPYFISNLKCHERIDYTRTLSLLANFNTSRLYVSVSLSYQPQKPHVLKPPWRNIEAHSIHYIYMYTTLSGSTPHRALILIS